MQIDIKVQLLKNAPGAILNGILAILERKSVHVFEKYNIPDRIYFGRGIVFRTYAYCNSEKAMVGSSVQAFRFILAGMCRGQPG
jgi:hypothetical protein